MDTTRIYQALGRDGKCWTVKIIYANKSNFPVTMEFGAELDPDGIVVEWKEVELHDAMAGSSCTIVFNNSLLSDCIADIRDLPFGAVRVEIYRGEYRYWLGVLDMDSYIEPFDRAANYDITLTAVDLGALKRFKFDMPKGQRVTLYDIISEGLSAAGIETEISYATGLYPEGLSTTSQYGIGLRQLSVLADNFYDEDGEADSWYDAIEAVLQPLGLRMIQSSSGWGSAYYVLNINDHTTKLALPIEWSATGQTRSNSKRVGRIELTYSPYGASTALKHETDFDELSFNVLRPINWRTYGLDCRYDDDDTQPVGFELTWGTATRGGMVDFTQINSPAYQAKIESTWSGSDTGCIMVSCYDRSVSPRPKKGTQCCVRCLLGGENPNVLFSSDPIHFTSKPQRLCIKLNMLVDGRYNPFETASNHNDEGNFKAQKKIGFIAVPLRVKFVGDNGAVYYLVNTKTMGVWGTHYDNCWIATTEPQTCWLAYYPDSGDDNFVDGWMDNKQLLGYFDASSSDRRIWTRRGNGEFIGGAPVAGTMTIEVLEGLYITHKTTGNMNNRTGLPDGDFPDYYGGSGYYYFTKLYWLLYKSLSVTVCDKNGKELEDKDIVYTAELDESRSEKLSLTTRCGSADGIAPTAKSVIYLLDEPVRTLEQYDCPGTPEELLMCSLATMYRKNGIVLEGEIKATHGTGQIFPMYTPRIENAFPDGRHVFKPTAAVHHCLLDTVDITLKEVWQFDKMTIYDIDKESLVSTKKS